MPLPSGLVTDRLSLKLFPKIKIRNSKIRVTSSRQHPERVQQKKLRVKPG